MNTVSLSRLRAKFALTTEWYTAHALKFARAVCAREFQVLLQTAKTKMRRSSFSVPTAAGQSPANVPVQCAAVPTPSQRSMPAEMLEMVKSLKKENKDIMS